MPLFVYLRECECEHECDKYNDRNDEHVGWSLWH